MKKLSVFILIMLAAAIFAFAGAVSAPAKAETDSDGNGETQTVDQSIDELLKNLDLSGVQGLLDALDNRALSVFGFGDIVSRVRAVASGEYSDDFGGIVTYVLAVLGADVLEFLPMLIGCIAIVLAYNVINSVKSRFASESTEKVVYFATSLLAVTLVVGYFSSVTASAVGLVSSLKNQIGASAPVLITLMTAAGAGGSASVYSPAVAVLASGMTAAVVYLAFPALLMGLVFDVIGSVSTGLKLGKTADFFRSACKWVLGTAFFLFIAVIGVSGITASVRDGISVRAARFAVSKYVPVIGVYLSQGFDFVMAGNVLIKNAVGSSVVVLIVLTAAPVITRIAVFTLTLKLTAAIAEPLGGDRTCGILTSISKSSSVIAAVVAAVTFLYILFLSMLICTGNIGL